MSSSMMSETRRLKVAKMALLPLKSTQMKRSSRRRKEEKGSREVVRRKLGRDKGVAMKCAMNCYKLYFVSGALLYIVTQLIR